MKIIFCADPLDARQVDSMYQAEANALRSLALDYALIDFEALLAGSPDEAVRRIARGRTAQEAIYRGWMLKPHQYQQLYEALLAQGLRLINTPAMYWHTHYLPESYPVIEPLTPRSAWLPVDDGFTIERVHETLKIFGNQPVIVKDYVKSQKHYWHEACFIPDASNRPAVERVVQRFMELQGNDLNAGLVFREFIEFEPLSQHSQSGMPLTKEFRVFFLDGMPIFSTKYWSEGDYQDLLPDTGEIHLLAKKVNSRFFTLDIARRTDGQWMIVEPGDGQVAGLPEHVSAVDFYRAILKVTT